MEEQKSHLHDSDVTIEKAETVEVAQKGSNFSIAAAVIVGALFISAALYFGLASKPASLGGGNNNTAGKAPVGNTQNSGSKANVTAGDMPVLGSSSAPVLVVEWGDYQCPFCERMFSSVEPQLKTNYIDTGKIRFAFRDFAFLGTESTDAAESARCANDQGQFWAYHDKLYNSQGQENSGAFSRDNLKKFAKDLGLDTAQFNACLDSDKYKQAVENDVKAGQDVGVSGTPATFVNGQLISGAQPYSSFSQAIDVALSGK